jgi:hypothetical protein
MSVAAIFMLKPMFGGRDGGNRKETGCSLFASLAYFALRSTRSA